jgi:gliding motility-associated-like protein
MYFVEDKIYNMMKNIYLTGLVFLAFTVNIFSQEITSGDTIAGNIVVSRTFSVKKNEESKCYYIRSLDNSRIESFEFVLYNRWGKMLFETDDIDKCWTGRENGVPVPEGTYIYLLNIEIISVEKKDSLIQEKYTGNLTVFQ